MFFEVDRWPSAGFRLDRGLMSGYFVENVHSRIVRKVVNANPGLKVNRIITFSSIEMFLAALFCA